MAKLIFRYGAMGSSKSASALMLHHNFISKGKKAILVKPFYDQRDGKYVRSGCGLKHECACETTMLNVVHDTNPDLIIVDEAQFADIGLCKILVNLVDVQNFDVVCYGLRTDFQGNLFEGSKYLLAHADKIEELKTICWCGKKCTHTLRIDANGEVVTQGNQIACGINYISVCRKHFNERCGRA